MSGPVPTTVPTSVGRAQVLHRLALAVECVDGVTGQLVSTPVRVGREVPPRLRSGRPEPSWPCLDLEGAGSARFLLRHGPTLPNVVTLRLADPTRRYVARTVRIPLWTLAEVAAVDLTDATTVPVLSRLLRPWLLPGSAYAFPLGTTGVRSRVVRAGKPVRWPRVIARQVTAAPPFPVVGWAHGDERGEFLLHVEASAVVPPPKQLDLQLRVSAPDPAGAIEPDPDDPQADLVREDVARSVTPPAAGDLDNDLLRGRLTPQGYLPSAGPPEAVAVPLAALLVHPPIEFTV